MLEFTRFGPLPKIALVYIFFASARVFTHLIINTIKYPRGSLVYLLSDMHICIGRYAYFNWKYAYFRRRYAYSFNGVLMH